MEEHLAIVLQRRTNAIVHAVEAIGEHLLVLKTNLQPETYKLLLDGVAAHCGIPAEALAWIERQAHATTP